MSIKSGVIEADKKSQSKTRDRSVSRDSSNGKINFHLNGGNVVGKNANTLLICTVTGVNPVNRKAMLLSIKNGLKFNSLEKLEKAFHSSRKEMSDVLSIPTSTLTRRKKEGKLHPDESDRVVRLANIRDAAMMLMNGNEEAAINWLKKPIDILDGESPLQHSSTELGARDVEDLIGRLQHGVFS